MEAKEITNKGMWENFLSQCEERTFLNSWNWGEFQKKMGEKIWRLGIYDNGELMAVALVIWVDARRGKFLFVPHGPNITYYKLQITNYEQIQNYKLQILGTLLAELKKIAKEEGASFIRIAPIFLARRSLSEGGERNAESEKIFKDLGFRNAPTHMHPEVTWELDITRTEDELLTGMRKTTRYLIRQALKNREIEIVQSRSIEDVDKFYDLHRETVGRHKFTPFSPDYIKKEFESFAPDNGIVIFHGKYRGKLVSSAVIIFWKPSPLDLAGRQPSPPDLVRGEGAAYYHHGATSLKYPKIPVAYLLQWEIIREAKRRGCAKYNFWGIAPTESRSHPWYGLTMFKTGFGGYKKEYLKTQDLPLSWRYWPIALFELFRRKKRGL